MTRTYNTANFVEDLKILFRTCGIQGKGTTFLFTDQDIKASIFKSLFRTCGIQCKGTTFLFTDQDIKASILNPCPSRPQNKVGVRFINKKLPDFDLDNLSSLSLCTSNTVIEIISVVKISSGTGSSCKKWVQKQP
jgi:predicted nucleic acid-binding Zn ribbon protein